MGMSRTLRRLVLAVVLIALTACGQEVPLVIGSDGELDAELVAFANPGAGSVGGVAVRIDSPAAAAGFAGWFASSYPGLATELTAKMTAARPGAGRVLLGFAGLGCAENGARLHRDGDDVSVEFTGGEGVNCVAAGQLVAVFAVDDRDLPDELTLVGKRPPSEAGPGDPVVFEGIDGGSELPRGGDLADAAVLDRFTGGLDERLSSAVRRAVEGAGEEERVLGMAVRGCRLEAVELVITGSTVEAVPVDPPNAPNCEALETYVVVFRVDADLVPADAEIRG